MKICIYIHSYMHAYINAYIHIHINADLIFPRPFRCLNLACPNRNISRQFNAHLGIIKDLHCW